MNIDTMMELFFVCAKIKEITQLTFTCSKLAVETTEKSVKYVQS